MFVRMFVIEQVIQRLLKGAREKLAGQINRQKSQGSSDRFVAGPVKLQSLPNGFNLASPT